MKYTFLVPAYKAAFLKDALGSILNQTYKDFNVIVSDDCSPEDLESIVRSFNDSRITYRRNNKNIGAENLVAHWNLLLELTDSDYIILASDDDIYVPTYLEEMDRLISRHQNALVFRPHINKIDADGNVIMEEDYTGEELLSLEEYLNELGRENIYSGIPQYIFKREELISIGGFVNYPYAWFSDDATVAAMALNGIAIAPSILFSFRISGQSISSRQPSLYEAQKKIMASSLFFNHIERLEKGRCSKTTKVNIYNRARRVTINILKKFNLKEFLNLMSDIRRLHSELYPPMWRLQRYIGFIVHDIVK